MAMEKDKNLLRVAQLDMPTHMEINGNREAVVDGCGGILEYSSETVRIRTGKMIVRFGGRGLAIRSLTADALVVTGFITGIEFAVR